MSTGPKDPSLSVSHGKTKLYVEVHNPYTFDPDDYDPEDLVGARYLDFQKVGCTCPLAIKCSRCPKFGLGTNPKFVFMCLWEIRWHMLNEDLSWRPTPRRSQSSSLDSRSESRSQTSDTPTPVTRLQLGHARVAVPTSQGKVPRRAGPRPGVPCAQEGFVDVGFKRAGFVVRLILSSRRRAVRAEEDIL